MRDFHLEIDISCNPQYVQFKPIYRVYVDNTLITERNYIWDSTHYIKEHVFVKLANGPHRIRVEIPKNMDNRDNPFTIHRVVYDGAPLPLSRGTINIS